MWFECVCVCMCAVFVFFMISCIVCAWFLVCVFLHQAIQRVRSSRIKDCIRLTKVNKKENNTISKTWKMNRIENEK